MQRKGYLLVISMLCMALFTGCTSNADTLPQSSVMPVPTGTPTASPPVNQTPAETTGPMVSLSPAQTAEPETAGANTLEDALRLSDRVSEEVEKLSELDGAEAIVAGSIALIGVTYDSQYQGGLTERLNQMVTERAEMIDKGITTVHVTDDADTVKRIAQLREKLKAGSVRFEELQTQLLDIGSGITGGDSPKVNKPQTETGA